MIRMFSYFSLTGLTVYSAFRSTPTPPENHPIWAVAIVFLGLGFVEAMVQVLSEKGRTRD